MTVWIVNYQKGNFISYLNQLLINNNNNKIYNIGIILIMFMLVFYSDCLDYNYSHVYVL